MSVETKFLNNSVDYCEEYTIKNMVCKYTDMYNKFLYNYKKKVNLNDNKDSEKIIPNNNKKFYLFIYTSGNAHSMFKSKKSDKCNTLYFFPDKKCKSYFDDYLLVKNTIDEFFIECDLKLEDPVYLLEGYLYGDNEKKHFLITDILFKGNNIIECDYEGRRDLINDLFMDKIDKMKNINNILSIGIHNCMQNHLLNIFLNNFIWKNDIVCIENVCNFEKNTLFLSENTLENKPVKNENVKDNIDKSIVKTKVSDIYNVYNINTNDYEGLLYISTLKMSKHLKCLFQNTEQLTLKCSFNKNFQKWQHI